jgi:hypothetical protein
MINDTNPDLAFIKPPIEGEVWSGLQIIDK